MFKSKFAYWAFTALLALFMMLTISVTQSTAQQVAPSNKAAASNPSTAPDTNKNPKPSYNNVSWSGPTDISHASIALAPDVAMNGGEAQINYSLGDVSVKTLYQTYSGDNGHTWTNASFRGCSNGSTVGSTPPQIAEDANFNVYMVWQDYCQDNRYLFFRKYDSVSNQWLPVRRITNFNTNGGAVTVGPNGSVHISYNQVFTSGSSARVEYMVSYDGGNTFSEPTLITDSRTWINSTTIAVDTNNRPHIAYDKGANGSYSIIASDFANGAWSTTTLYGGRSFWPDIQSDNNGGVGLVWQINDAGIQVYMKRWNPASLQWDPVSTNISVNDSKNFNPALTFDNLGQSYVTWAESDGDGDLHLEFTYEISRGAWANNVAVDESRTTAARMANWNNNLLVAYQSDVPGNWRIMSRWIQLPQAALTPSATPTNTDTPTNTPSPTNTPTATPSPTATPCADGSTFRDVCSSYWAHDFIEALAARGIVHGNNGYFYPDNLISRAELSVIVARSQNWPTVTPTVQSFTDVPPSYFAYAAIETAKANGAISGYDQATCIANGAIYPCFLPNLVVKRDETAAIIVKASGYPRYTPGTPTFPDVPSTYWAYTFIETAVHQGVISGRSDGLFHPSFHTKRGEMAKIVYFALPLISTISPASAHAGSNELVTIVGRNFGDPQSMTSTLQINGTTMNIVAWHDTTISFYVPANTPLTPSPANIQLTWNTKLAFIANGVTFTVLAGPTATPAPPTNTAAPATDTPLPPTATVSPMATLTDTPQPTITPTALAGDSTN